MAADPGTDPMTAWLRSQIGERRALAEAAGGKEWRTGCSGEHGPMSHYPGCEQVEGDDITVYAEGGHNADQAAHIAANDPQDTIARCDAELAILDEHGPLPDCPAEMIAKYRAAGFPETQIAAMEAMVSCVRCHVPVDDAREDEEQCRPVEYPCRTVRLVASGYRHRPGFRQDWLP